MSSLITKNNGVGGSIVIIESNSLKYGTLSYFYNNLSFTVWKLHRLNRICNNRVSRQFFIKKIRDKYS